MVPVFLFVVFACTYPPVKVKQFLLNLLTYNYLAVRKPKFAWVQDDVLCEQKSQCSGQGFLVSLPWGSCHP